MKNALNNGWLVKLFALVAIFGSWSMAIIVTMIIYIRAQTPPNAILSYDAVGIIIWSYVLNIHIIQIISQLVDVIKSRPLPPLTPGDPTP
ncbi:MAG: hypothetical protein KGJ90_07350 [Patescibacteria group bacterium]|nr:hypothetical protein [Patescibacteria group bacterium]